MKVDPVAILAVALFIAGMAGIAIAHAETYDGPQDEPNPVEPEIVSQTEG